MENSLLIKRIFGYLPSGDWEFSNLLLSLREKKVDHRKRLEVQSNPLSPSFTFA